MRPHVLLALLLTACAEQPVGPSPAQAVLARPKPTADRLDAECQWLRMKKFEGEGLLRQVGPTVDADTLGKMVYMQTQLSGALDTKAAEDGCPQIR